MMDIDSERQPEWNPSKEYKADADFLINTAVGLYFGMNYQGISDTYEEWMAAVPEDWMKKEIERRIKIRLSE